MTENSAAPMFHGELKIPLGFATMASFLLLASQHTLISDNVLIFLGFNALFIGSITTLSGSSWKITALSIRVVSHFVSWEIQEKGKWFYVENVIPYFLMISGMILSTVSLIHFVLTVK